MCGISGLIGIESRDTSEPILRRMLASIFHRGPDDEGVLIVPRAAVGTRRLSIIDLAGGSQPIRNEAGTLAVVFNGEIYNFRSLRQQLESLGHQFRTLSDTEAIVHAYEAWGAECVQHLEGMFAFAIVELPEGCRGRAARVFLARDRLGIKPLYYATIDGVLYFASEVRALIASGRIAPRLSAEAVPSYLLFGSVAEPSTFVDQVLSLPPGHWLSVNPAEPIRTVEPKPYWNACGRPRASASCGEKLPAVRVRALMEQAVKSHLVADVRIGVFLSSGIDSTAIAVLASGAQKGIHTFTVAFPEAEFSEADTARRTAKALGTNHSEISISEQEMVSRLDEAVAAFDQPSADGINTYFVSWAARQAGLKVALSGLGSDELFGGYTNFRATRQVARLAKLGRVLPRPLRSFVADQIRGTKSTQGSRDPLRKALAAWLDPRILPHPYFFTRSLFTPQTVASRLHGGAAQWDSAGWFRWLAAAARQSETMDGFTAVSWLELRSYLLSTLLRDTDAMSMSHSLEVRVPFLDRTLVEYVLSVPESVKCAAGRPKSLLVDAMRDLLPNEVVAQSKRTFTFPWEIWLRGNLGERVSESLSDWSTELEPRVSGHFAAAVWRDFLRGRTSWSRPWSLYVLNEWTKRNLRGHSSATEERKTTAAATAR
jgi:asparagine synthase (glutamine-hydrolysing)